MALSLELWAIIIGGGFAALLILGIIFGKKEIERFKTVNDKILYVTYSPRRSHWYYWVLGLAIILTGLYARGTALLIISLAILDLILIAEFAHQKSRIILTESTVILTKGFIARNVLSINYGDIKVVQLKEGELGRLLGYSDLYIDVVGAKQTFVFHNVQKPLKVKRDIETEREKHTEMLEGRK